MRVDELIDILSKYPRELEVELAIVAPSDPQDIDISVDHYSIDGVYQYSPSDEDDVVWLLGGEADDVEDLLDALPGGAEGLADDGDL